jgi:pimeloyl-ACP methyl ester carboxylesterase
VSGTYDARIGVSGEGDAIVLVPGMNGSPELFYRQLPRLRRRFRVATYTLRDDAPGHETLADDLAAVIDNVAPVERRAIVVGESFGGTVALTCALRHPARVAALVVLNSFPFFTPQFRLNLAIAGLRALPWGAMVVVRRFTASRLHSRHTHARDIRTFLDLTSRSTREGYLNRLRLLTSFDVRQRLADIRQPTLFLASELDHLVPAVAQARYMAALVPGGVMRVLEGHGHICLIAPDLDLAAILHEWHGWS